MGRSRRAPSAWRRQVVGVMSSMTLERSRIRPAVEESWLLLADLPKAQKFHVRSFSIWSSPATSRCESGGNGTKPRDLRLKRVTRIDRHHGPVRPRARRRRRAGAGCGAPARLPASHRVKGVAEAGRALALRDDLSRLVICICRARRSKPSSRRAGPPKTNSPDEALSATVSTMPISQFVIRLPTISRAGIA